jgi:uncharacterized protein (TIGR03067 family)
MPRNLDGLQGSWTITSLVLDGQPLPAALLAGGRITIQGDRFVSTGMGAEYSGTLVLDTTKRPRHLDMKFETGPEEGNTNPCIYELAGDTLKLCIATRGAVRPSSFRSPPGSGIASETLVRGGALLAAAAPAPRRAKAVAPAKADGEPATEFEGEWRMVSGTMAGQRMDDDTLKWVKRVTRGRQTTVYAGPQVMMAFEFTTDASRSPNTIDYAHTAGVHKGKEQHGIYELAASRLTILMAAPGQPRPTRIDAPPGNGGTLTVWKRAK